MVQSRQKHLARIKKMVCCETMLENAKRLARAAQSVKRGAYNAHSPPLSPCNIILLITAVNPSILRLTLLIIYTEA